jgi:type I restriction enzyme S subunit
VFWADVPFAELLVESRDGEWGKGEPEVGHTEAVVIRGTDFASVNDPDHQLPHRWIKDHLVRRKKLIPGDIVFEMAGGTSTQSTGRSAFLRTTFFQTHQPLPAICASFSRHLRLDKERFSPEFIYYLLQTLHRSGYMGVFHVQHTGVARFQYSSFKKHTTLKLPALSHQRKIAAILTAYDDLIETNKRRIALLEKMAEELYREWFVRMRFPGHEQAKRVKGIPTGWDVKLLSECADINPSSIGRTNRPESIHYIDISSATTNHINSVQAMPFSEAPGRARRKVQHGDIIWSSVRPANRAYCLIYKPVDNVVVSTGFAVIRPKPQVPFTYLKHAVTTDGFVDQMTAVAKGAAYPATSFDDFQKAKLLWPTDELLSAFHQRAEPLFALAHTLTEQINLLGQARDLLLPRLISGKLSVEDLDIQFPPSMRDDAPATQDLETQA